MCLMCQGWSADEVNALHHERIRSTGWTTTGVAEGPGRPTCVYTIGLALVGHPDLLVASVAVARATEILDELAGRVVAGERLDLTGDVTCDDEVTMALHDIHAVHVQRGLVGAGQRYYDWVGRPEPALRVRQVVVPASSFCSCHAGTQPRLHLPHVLFGTAGPGRAERRRTAQRRRTGR